MPNTMKYMATTNITKTVVAQHKEKNKVRIECRIRENKKTNEYLKKGGKEEEDGKKGR